MRGASGFASFIAISFEAGALGAVAVAGGDTGAGARAAKSVSGT